MATPRQIRHWRELAERARSMADHYGEKVGAGTLLEVAETYDEMADEAEADLMHSPG